MATFIEHIHQATKNLDFLCQINSKCREFIDWQTTSCFYTAVHLINAHVTSTTGDTWRTHAQVDNAINPFRTVPLRSALPEDIYLNYNLLKNLSRRSRYLISHDNSQVDNRAYPTTEKHFTRAITYLDKILSFMVNRHSCTFTGRTIDCSGLAKKQVQFFTHSSYNKD